MARIFLVRGMLCGLVAGILAFLYAHQVGEPEIGRAIAFETARQVASGEPADPEIFSRAVQSGVGLLTGVTVVSVALGGLFGLVYASLYGRVAVFGARGTALALGAAAFVVTDLVPALKYPANPPSVGVPATLVARTQLFFSMIAISLAFAVLAALLGRAIAARVGAWNATIACCAAYVVAIAVAQALMPGLDEVPRDFSAVVLWRFRLASLGTYAIVWATIGVLFGYLCDRAAAVPSRGSARRSARPA